MPSWESSAAAENQPKQRTAPTDSQAIPEPPQKRGLFRQNQHFHENGILEKAQNLKTKKRVGNPRQYVSQDELDSVSSYMKGRLTIERINKAVDEMASRAESNSKLLEVARSKGGTVTSEERRHAMEVLYKITVNFELFSKFDVFFRSSMLLQDIGSFLKVISKEERMRR